MNSEWYKHGWSLDMKKAPWVEATEQQVNFLVRTLSLSGKERILDLACGFGRHSIAFAKRGYDVVGVDITPAFIEDARRTAKKEHLTVDFICADIRDTAFIDEFDVVISMADGAIGYLENEEENMKIFDRISAALKPGGKHFMDICSREHAEACFPKRAWEIGSKSVSLAYLDWDHQEERLLYWGWDIPYGTAAAAPAFSLPPTGPRLYSKTELRDILSARRMTILQTFSDYDGSPDTYKQLQLMVYSRKVQ